MEHAPDRRPDRSLDSDHLTTFDLLIEQQDYEALDGGVSLFTQQQLRALAEGEPIPQVNLDSPEIQAATARVLQSFRQYRESKTHPSLACGDDDEWSDNND